MRDLLYPDTRPGVNQRSDADLIDDIERLAPHLVRPVRLVDLAAAKPSFLKRFIGGGRSNSENIDLTNHQAGRPLAVREAAAQLVRCMSIDSSRLCVVLARDFIARGGDLQIDRTASADDVPLTGSTSPDAFAPSVAVVTRRTFREEFAYRLRCADGEPLIVMPLDQDLVLVERYLGTAGTEEALEHLKETYANWFGTPLAPDVRAGPTCHDDPTDFSCIQDLRQGDSYLQDVAARGIPPVERAGLSSDGHIGDSYGAFANTLAANYSHLDAAYIRGLVARHGPVAPDVLGACHRDEDLGTDFGGGLRAREARWMLDQEFARSAEDIACRRGPFALRGTDIGKLQDWIDRGARLR